MGQWDVVDFLELYPDTWFSVLEISRGMCITNGSACVSCERLRKSNLVLWKKSPRLLGRGTRYNLMVHKYKKVKK
jgi:hypothetical protein